ncbi:MAG: oxygenase MpaB family protein [Nocardioides sp.]
MLSTFVVVPKRWMDDYGWRPFTAAEVGASTRYYVELGRLMGIKDIPTTYDAFERLLDDHEAEHFAFDPASRRVGDATFALMKTFYPRAVAWPVDVFSRALMDEPVRFEVERLGTFPRGCPVRHGNETAPSSGNDEGRPDRRSGGAPLAS